jgi:hypothetical protein
MRGREILAWVLALFFVGATLAGGVYLLGCSIRDRWRQWRSK